MQKIFYINLLYIGIDGFSVIFRDIILEFYIRFSRIRGRQGGGDNLGNVFLREVYGFIYI